MKHVLVVSIVVLMMAALGAGVAGAQEPADQQFGNRGPRDGGVINAVSETIGLTPQEIFEALQEEGATLASVIEANGGDVDAILAQLIANAPEDLSEEQVAALEEHLNGVLNGEFGPGGSDDKLTNVAELLGVDVETLLNSLRDDQTIADIAAANNVDVQTVIDALVADAEARIAEAVESGRLTPEEGEARQAEVTERVTDFVNNTDENRPGQGGPGGDGGPGGQRGPGGAPPPPQNS